MHLVLTELCDGTQNHVRVKSSVIRCYAESRTEFKVVNRTHKTDVGNAQRDNGVRRHYYRTGTLARQRRSKNV